MVLAALTCWGPLDCQTTDVQPAFEVASVKLAPPYEPGQDNEMRGGPGTNNPERISYPRTSLPTLLAMAYEVRSDQISGPDLLRTERYSVFAKVPPNTTRKQFNLMLQNLLAERFHLTLHHEQRDFQVYELLVAEGGPKMKPAPPDPDAGSAPLAPNQPPYAYPVRQPGDPMAMRTVFGMVRTAHRQTMAQFAERLGQLVNMSNGDGVLAGDPPIAHVIDRTGLTGVFDFQLEFAGSFVPSSPVASLATERGDQRPPESVAASDPPGGPTLFAALEKQLGLRLVKRKVGLDVLVIDHVDRVPAEN